MRDDKVPRLACVEEAAAIAGAALVLAAAMVIVAVATSVSAFDCASASIQKVAVMGMAVAGCEVRGLIRGLLAGIVQDGREVGRRGCSDGMDGRMALGQWRW